MTMSNAGQRVLIVDDSRDVHVLLRVGLKPEQLELVSALGPEEGLAMATSMSPDLVLLDVDMPGMNGFDVCRALKESPDTRDVPVVFLTGEDDVEIKVRGFDLGAVDYIVKPWNVPELRARVRAALRTRRLQLLLATRAQTDGLTGLWNRAYFDARLAEEIRRAERHHAPLALALLDLDHFKLLNDRFGHPAGDRALQDTAGALVHGARCTDVVCRYGGEEFAVILPETDISGAEVVAQRLCASLRARLRRPDGSRLTCSVGVVANMHGGGPAEVLRLADEALYRAKAAGRDRVAVAA